LNISGKTEDSVQKPVKIYSLSNCVHCKATKKLLNESAIQYDFIDVDLVFGDERTAALEDVKKYNPELTFPTIIIGNEVIVGFEETQIKRALAL
jgi:glutaredoxin-like protein NrdH